MKTKLIITTSCEEETERFGTLIAAALDSGNVTGLCGNLGAGKTVVARGISRGLGIEDNITSPTFVIMNRYECPPPRSVPFYHFDLYRTLSPGEFEDLGFEDILRGEGICVIEWADKVPGTLGGDAVKIDIRVSKENENGREITLTANEKQAARFKKEIEKSFKL